MEAPRLIEVTATLRADDVGALAAWYRDALGFEIQMLWGEPGAGRSALPHAGF
jgi:hypothetical protein